MYNIMLRRLAPLLAALALPTQAETITIGQGTGVLWEGMPFDATLSGPMENDYLRQIFGIAAISNQKDRCMLETDLKTIAGRKALEIAPGVGLVPKATIRANYTFLYSGEEETLTGTIGEPETKGDSSAGVTITNPVLDRYWCLPPRMGDVDSFYDPTAERTVTIVGSWLLVADGSQSNTEISIPPMWAGSYANVSGGDRFESILPSTIRLRISNLACTVATPLTIDFGHVPHSTEMDKELARQENQFDVTCTQDTNHISTNINVQLSAISGTYNGSPNKLALRQGGGYITGALEGLTGDGRCSADNGLLFDNTKQPLGAIKSTEDRQDFHHRVIWRLCSGGNDLPVGPVDASAELMVTFN